MKISEVKQLVADRRFVTARTQDSKDINAYEYCWINAHLVRGVPPDQLADLVSHAWTALDLRTKCICLVTRRRSGKATLTYPESLIIPAQPAKPKRTAEKGSWADSIRLTIGPVASSMREIKAPIKSYSWFDIGIDH